MRLHVLTACTRPENLPALAESLSQPCYGPWEVCWHLRLDPDHCHVGGQRLKNDMLDQISDGWVCFLDDDTTLDAEFVRLAEVLSRNGASAVVVSQARADGSILRAARGNLCVGGIDIGQAIISRVLIDDTRIPLCYDGDGMFLAAVLNTPNVVFIDEVLSYHNRLEPVAA